MSALVSADLPPRQVLVWNALVSPGGPGVWSSAGAAGTLGFHSWQKFGQGDPRCRPQGAPHPKVASTHFDPKTVGWVPHPSEQGREGSFTDRSAGGVGPRSTSWRTTQALGPPVRSSSGAFKKTHSLACDTDRPAVAFPRSGQGVRKFAPSAEPRDADSPVPDELVRQVSSCVTRASHRTRGIHELGAQSVASRTPTPTQARGHSTRSLARGSRPGEVEGPHRVIARVLLTCSLTGRCVPPVLIYTRGESHRI